MRKHDARKWLHAVLDLLPVILIPVFMVYSHRHEINDNSITVEQMTYYESNEVEENTDLIVGNIYKWTDGVEENELQNSDMRISVYIPLFKEQYPNLANENITLVNILISSNTFVYYQVYVNGNIQFENISATFSYFIIESITNQNHIYSDFLEHVQYTNYMYEKGIDLVTYADTDVMSQFFYCLYNSVDKYFNMGNVFNLNGVYRWFNVNIFGGNAPLSIYVVWNIVLYEFVMDLLFLLYGLFMWFIDMCTRLMEKPLNSIK